MTTKYVINSKDVFSSDLIFADKNLYACRKTGSVQDNFNDIEIPLKQIVFRTPTKDKQLYDIFNAPHNRFIVHSYLTFHLENRRIGISGQEIKVGPPGESESKLKTLYEIRLHCRIKDACLKLLMIHHLQHHVHARLGKSNFGVGVFAIRDIPRGMPIFDNLLTKCANYRPVSIRNVNVKKINSGSKSGAIESLLADFFLQKGEQINYPVPVYGPNSIDTSFYLNHSDKPNLEITYPAECDMSVYVAARNIEAGEELSIDYRQFGFTPEEICARMPFLTNSVSPNPNKKRCLS